MKILMCFGTRPEAIKMAPLYFALREAGLQVILCVSAQHRTMLDQVLKFFNIVPDFDLDLMEPSQALNALCARILTSLDAVLDEVKPDLVLVHGDTTTSAMSALAAFHKGIKIGHVEAGLRTYNLNAPFPEEMNRQMTGRLATYHFAPTDEAAANLVSEKIAQKNIVVTGNTVIDALLWTNAQLDAGYLNDEIANLQFLETKRIILVTGHRRENFGQGFINLCNALLRIAEEKEVAIVFPVHLNPNVQIAVRNMLGSTKNIFLIEPISYPAMVYLMKNCELIISDSGGIQEEAPALGKHVLVTRDVSERPEGVAAGCSTLVGTNTSMIVDHALKQLGCIPSMGPADTYGDGRASERIVSFLKLNSQLAHES